MVAGGVPSGGGASVLWGAGRQGCYAGLWCISGLGWGILDKVKNVPIYYIRA